MISMVLTMVANPVFGFTQQLNPVFGLSLTPNPVFSFTVNTSIIDINFILDDQGNMILDDQGNPELFQ